MVAPALLAALPLLNSILGSDPEFAQPQQIAPGTPFAGPTATANPLPNVPIQSLLQQGNIAEGGATAPIDLGFLQNGNNNNQGENRLGDVNQTLGAIQAGLQIGNQLFGNNTPFAPPAPIAAAMGGGFSPTAGSFGRPGRVPTIQELLAARRF